MVKKISALSLCFLMLLSTVSFAFDDISTELDQVTATKNDVIVIVPGICGSELVNSSGTKIWVGVASVTPQIECNELGNSLVNLYPYNNDNYGAVDLYKTLYTNLSSRFSSNADIKLFAYDWRMSNATAATSLKNLVSSYSGQIILIAHSMGGLVVSDYLRQATVSQRNRTTFISLGTPFTGAPKAVQVMESGEMFPGIPTDYDNEYVKNLCRNLQGAYELLPTSRSDTFLQVNGIDKNYSSSWTILQSRPWANMQSGSGGKKPMLQKAVTFHSNQAQSNGSPYCLAARNTVMITSTGYSTPAKVNYQLTNGVYSVASIVSTNNGDGTVPAYSSQNKLADSNSHVVRVTNGGTHIGLVSSSTIFNRIVSVITTGLAGETVNSVSPNLVSEDAVVENDRGWLIGTNIDGRRMQVITDGTNKPLVLANGIHCEQYGDDLFLNGTYVGACWQLSDNRFQLELLNGNYKVKADPVNSDASIEISYMENGYYDSHMVYEDISSEFASYEIQINSFDHPSASVSSNGITFEPTIVATSGELSAMNDI